MSELRDYLRAYWSQRWLIIGIIFIATGAAVISAMTSPSRFAVSESFAINRINIQPTTGYQYDGYYSLLAVDQFAQTVVSWFATPSVLRTVYEVAKIDPEITSVNSLPGRFKVKKYSAQNIVIRFSERDQARAEALANGIRDTMEQQAARLNQTSDGKPQFEILGTDPVIAKSQPSPVLWGGVALVLSAGFALLAAALRYYLRQG